MKWGEITWIFLHTLSVQIQETQYNVLKTELFNHVKSLCSCLPCPDCAMHATQYLSRMPVPPTKSDFIRMLLVFHNDINQRNKKPIFYLPQMKKYNVVNLTLAFNVCKHIITHQPYNPRIIMNKLKTSKCLKDLTLWLQKNNLIR